MRDTPPNWRTVLPVGLEPATLERLHEALTPLQAVVVASADNWAEAVDLAMAGRYDGLVVNFPLAVGRLSHLLEAVRRADCPCRNAAVVLLAAERFRGEAESFVGRGANRVVAREEMELLLAEALERLFAVAPRVALRLPSRIEVANGGFARKVYCQTVNISTTGMLLRVPHTYRTGTEVGFELLLPEGQRPITGRARVVRHTAEAREPYPGVGVAFTEVRDARDGRLAAYLERFAS
ncbi:MAG TPA: PilZ domain-containing protein [Thermoanaerobaculaceae bacterium]|nr:PilZ domain-containing protein [Thermoanaerobaculaceae bacterium]